MDIELLIVNGRRSIGLVASCKRQLSCRQWAVQCVHLLIGVENSTEYVCLTIHPIEIAVL